MLQLPALNKIKYFLIITFLTAISLTGQVQKKVNGEDIKNIISIIASDEYMGRETGTEGCRMTEEYFAKEFKKLNLIPAGENGSYFFSYTFPFYKVEGDVELTIDDRKFYYGRDEDYRVMTYSDGGKISGEVVFVGFGINSEKLKRKDFINMDIKGKVVLIRRGCPKNDWSLWKDYAIDSIKAEYCHKEGAAGILFFEPAQSQQSQAQMSRADREISNELSKFNQIKNFPVFLVDERVARYILRDAEPVYNSLLRMMDTGNVSISTGKIARMSARVSYERERNARDVLAMLKGSDSKLSKEAVMIGGHLDHVGVDIDGKIYNGADDNASGSATVLGIARQMVKDNYKPRRSVIFAVWSGEEKGLLGSTAWCKNPTLNLENIVVYFNLDMVGLGETKLNLPGSYYADLVWNEIVQNTDSTTLKNVTASRGGPGGSDHTPFLQKGVPAMFGITSGSHPDYHQPGDDPEKISSDILQFVGDFMYHSIDVIANSSTKFITPNRNEIGKFKLATLFNLTPVGYSDYREKLNTKEIDISLVTFTESYDQTDPDRSFLTILRKFDEALRLNSTNQSFNFVQNPTDISGLAYQNKIGLIGAINLASINYNDLYAKILIKTGLKVGIIDRGAPFAKESTDVKETLNNISNNGMALLLNDLPTNELNNILLQVDRPAGIISSDPSTLPSILNPNGKIKNHLFIYRIDDQISIQKITEDIINLRKNWGDDNFTITPDKIDGASVKFLQDLYIALENKIKDDDFLNKLFSGNVRRFLQTATQERQQIVSRGRPF